MKNLITYTLIFSFLLTTAGCFTTNYYSETPENMIENEQGQKGIVYEDLDSLTMINNKTIDLDLYTARFIKSRTDSNYKFVYYYPRVVFDTAKMLSLKSNKAFYKDAVPDTLDIRNISYLHYTEKKMLPRTYTLIGLGVGIPAFILFFVFLFSIPIGGLG